MTGILYPLQRRKNYKSNSGKLKHVNFCHFLPMYTEKYHRNSFLVGIWDLVPSMDWKLATELHQPDFCALCRPGNRLHFMAFQLK